MERTNEGKNTQKIYPNSMYNTTVNNLNTV